MRDLAGNGDAAGVTVPGMVAGAASLRGVRWVGSKGAAGVWQSIVSAMPPHAVYIEPFLGKGVVMQRKRPAASSIGIDSDGAAPGLSLCQAVPGFIGKVADGREFLRRYVWRGDELVYADPPYLRSVRSCPRRYYRCELLTADEHSELLALLKSLPCLVMISGYWSQLYAKELAGWRTLTIPTVNRRGKRVMEWVFMNFPAPESLHDFRHIGTNFRERERIKRKISRWQRRLLTMPAVERAALRHALRIESSIPAMLQTVDARQSRRGAIGKEAGL